MAAVVYILSALVSMACAALLLRSFSRARGALLFWAGLCFAGLTLNNIMLFVDEIATDGDLSTWPAVPALAGMLMLVFGLVWEKAQP